MITQMDIEEKAFDYCVNNNRSPRFVLLNKSAYEKFSESFRPRQRIIHFDGVEVALPGKVESITTVSGMMEILSVDTEKELFEVVG